VELKLAGHDAHFAADGDETIEIIDSAEIRFDLIIINHQIARLAGLDWICILEEKGFVGEIIVLTPCPRSSITNLINLFLEDTF